MPGRRKEPTREDRAMNADEVENKIRDAAGSIFAVTGEIDELTNPQLVADWQQLQSDLEALAVRASKLAC